MWKTIALCASLFTGAALGLAGAARWIEPGALPAAAAIGLCLIGVVLILAAPAPELGQELPATSPTPRPALVSNASAKRKAIEVSAPVAPATPAPQSSSVEKIL